MKLLLNTALLFSLAGILCPAEQPNTSNPAVNEIIVRVLNGTDGKPIKNEVLGVLLGNGRPKNYRTDRNGEVFLSIAGVQTREIQVWLTNFYIDCETYGDESGQSVSFSLDEITSKGTVAANRCGQDRRQPSPGILIVYRRKMTRKERRLI
jgi:hypothetical protein